MENEMNDFAQILRKRMWEMPQILIQPRRLFFAPAQLTGFY
jgi:hypothetical protein